jgi:hypothetical protein
MGSVEGSDQLIAGVRAVAPLADRGRQAAGVNSRRSV